MKVKECVIPVKGKYLLIDILNLNNRAKDFSLKLNCVKEYTLSYLLYENTPFLKLSFIANKRKEHVYVFKYMSDQEEKNKLIAIPNDDKCLEYVVQELHESLISYTGHIKAISSIWKQIELLDVVSSD